MATATGMSQSAISRIWRAFGLKPHLVETGKPFTVRNLQCPRRPGYESVSLLTSAGLLTMASMVALGFWASP